MGETLQSDIGKPNSTIVLSNFEVTDRTMNKKRLKELLDLIKEFELLSGRSRLQA